MLSVGGRKLRPLVIGSVVVLALILFSLSWSGSPIPGSITSETIHKADYGIGESVQPANKLISNDDTLLSGATIEQDKKDAEKKKQFVVGSSKSDVSSGSDASLKGKLQDKNKPETEMTSFADSKDSDEVAAVNPKAKVASGADSTDDDKTNVKGGKVDSVKDKSASGSTSDSDYDYVIMIDAGSTGSRVHVYTFDTYVSPPVLINEDFKMLKPGLSSFDVDTVGAAASLDPLLELALKSIPKEKHSCTPVAVKATAGLRLLGTAKSDAILKEVRRHLEEDYPFPVVEGDGISIMDGSDEGVYAWITTNYLLKNIGSSKKLDTAAVFDLGGGSTQIVFEPTDGEKILEGEHKYEINFGGRDFILYQYSHLGYGLMQARNKVNAAVLKAVLADPKSKVQKSKLVPLNANQLKNKDAIISTIDIENPCIPPGVTADNVVVEMENGDKYAVTFISPENETPSSLAGQCKLLTDTILNKDLACESKSCSFNGVYQPSFLDQFSTLADMYVFSYFYDRLQPIGMPDSFTLKEMNDIMSSVCSGSHLWDQYFTQAAHIKELEDEPLWCMDLNFMTSLLHTGYDIPLTRELRTAKTIGGNELGWCLGASLPLLDKTNWKCKVTKL